MSDLKSNFWEERYSSEEYVYGVKPNQFFKQVLNKIPIPGKLLLPGEGEGRNAVYAAKMGWKVDAFDQSYNAKAKAEKLAMRNKVVINYSIVDLGTFTLTENHYNAASIIFVHFVPETRRTFHKKIIDSLKPGGKIILELFSKDQLGKSSGGPQDLEMLYSIDEIKNDFKVLNEENVFLDEGEKHKGEASVIRFVGEMVE
ncbi:MAG: class I SAM-dependent methyltransferase [Ignavibacteriaceae bacterium]|nr:class I SAM-dependent methyltransferase [Ignavibacteriaceae bacterium]